MSEKVVIMKDQAEAIERLLRNEWSKKQILICHFETPNGWDIKDNNGLTYNHLNHMDFEELVKALYIGYVVKKTPEEMVLMFYQEEKKFCNKEAYLAIERTLHLLGIEIEGVNK